jgi:2-polyprenyl-3-methyl-5-hydroxy-6-metoxy-1,4-benzoquinol methylase
MQITKDELDQVFRLKYGDNNHLGPVPRMWQQFGYTVTDNFYEAAITKLVQPGSFWLDVGCGRSIFPQNGRLAEKLASRCGLLVGVDPDANLDENPFVHKRVRGKIENYRDHRHFDVVSFRMVAEHIEDPSAVIEALARLTKPRGKVVIYTVNQWSPVSILAKILSFQMHHLIKRIIWGTEERDTFPVTYRMNTRKRLADLFNAGGFREHYFQYIDDARLFFRFPRIHRLELTVWRFFRAMGIKYPETCLLGIYEREP